MGSLQRAKAARAPTFRPHLGCIPGVGGGSGPVPFRVPAAFPPGLMNWMQTTVHPIADAMSALSVISMPVGMHGVFSAASPTEFLKVAAPGVMKALSSRA